MADEKPRLGRSLESLISAARGRSLNTELIQSSGHRVQTIAVENIEPNPFQPRREFDVEALNELVESLRHHGLMQPIVVRQAQPKFQLVAGERRWRASRELGWETISAVVITADDRRMLEWALVENIQRQSLGAMELAHAWRQLADEFQLTQGEVGQAVGMSRPAVANILRLLDLPTPVQDHVSRGTLSMGSARALLSLPTPGQQLRMAEEVTQSALSVREVEERVRGIISPSKTTETPNRRASDPNQLALADELQTLLGTKVALKGSLSKGKLIINYHTARELDRLVRRLRGQAPGFDEFGDDDGEATLTV